MEIVREEGVGGLFAGVSASALRHGIYSTTRLGLYEVMKQKGSEEEQRRQAAADKEDHDQVR
jgi:solute carrier family 25 oxoglutarate transporter 11